MTETLRPIPNAYWVVPGRFLAGENPAAQGSGATRQRLGALLEAGLNVFVDLIAADEAFAYESLLKEEAAQRSMHVSHYRFGIPDLGVPSTDQMRRTLDTLDAALTAGDSIYLHCWAGIGRTGTTVGCYLVRHGLSGEAALAQLAAWWRTVPKSAMFARSPETETQAAYIRSWIDASPAAEAQPGRRQAPK
jgi:protein-tyrosine phosphatase